MTQYDLFKIQFILHILVTNPNGVWYNKLKRETNITDPTLARYVRLLEPIIEIQEIRSETKILLKTIKLKQTIYKKIESQIITIDEIIEILKYYNTT